MSVLLLEPLVDERTKWGRFSSEKGYIPPLGMIALYSYLKSKQIPVRLIDTQFGDYTKEDIGRIRQDRDITIVGIPVFTNSAHYSFLMAKFCREVRPDLIIVLGGVHVTSLPERTIEECPWADYIVIGEGEVTFHELILRLNAGQSVEDLEGIGYRKQGKPILTAKRAFIDNLDLLPMTCYDDIDITRYVPHPTQYRVLPNMPIVTQRGCPFQCTFCEAGVVQGKKMRRFSVNRVLDELELLSKKYGAKGVYFQDSTFTADRKYTVNLLNGILERGIKLQWACNTRCDRVDYELLGLMKKAGCWLVTYGVESANQQSLDLLKKGISIAQAEKAVSMTKKAGISLLCSFILALPGETENMVENTISFAKKLLPDMALFFLPVPYPGSELYRTCKNENSIREDANWEDYLAVDFKNPVYISPMITKERMLYFYNKAYREFYRNPRYILKALLKLRSIYDFKRYFRGLRALLHASILNK